MVEITSDPTEAGHPGQEIARLLFGEYGEFLKRTQACGGTFDFERFAEEVRTLPGCYADHGGDVLLAWIDGQPAGIIAYRSAAISSIQERTCEIKRLYVREEARGQRLARTLLSAAMQRAESRGFTRAILDSDVDTMPGAVALYRSLGFTEYGQRHGNLAFFERGLP